MDNFDRGCDYRRLEEFFSKLPENERFVFVNQAAAHRDCTPVDIAISAIRELILLRTTPELTQSERGDLEEYDTLHASIPEFLSSVDVAIAAMKELKAIKSKPVASSKSDDMCDVIRRIAVSHATRIDAFEESLAESHRTATHREFSTLEVLKEFDGKLKELEATVESIGRGTERHQIALENGSIATTASMNRELHQTRSHFQSKIDDIEHDIADILIRMPGPTVSVVEQDSKSSLAKAAYMRWKNGMYQSGKCAPQDWESTSISERAVWMDVVSTENPAS